MFRLSQLRPLLTILALVLVTGLATPVPVSAAPVTSAPGTTPVSPLPGDSAPSSAVPTTPHTDDCPHKIHTPPAVDQSETVAPGESTPAPLPVPDSPIGGAQLGSCGVIADTANGPVPAHLTSAGWVIADLDSGAIIAAKDPHGRYRPASTIKVLLALVALDELDLDTVVGATADDYSMEGDSCGMGPGGRYSNRDILTGLLVVSGNDCANNLARQLGGYHETLTKMNAKAKELGALDTRAASPSGLDAAGMSISPYDLAVIFRAAMANKTFAEIVAKPTYKFPGYPKRGPDDVDHPAWMMYTSNTLLRDGYPGMLGGKTGYTDDALKTYVGAVERDGRRLLIVQMYGLSYEHNMYSDQAIRMFDYGFAAKPDTSVGTLVLTAASTPKWAGPDQRGTPQLGASPTGNDHAKTWAIGAALVGVAAVIAVLFLLPRRRRRG